MWRLLATETLVSCACRGTVVLLQKMLAPFCFPLSVPNLSSAGNVKCSSKDPLPPCTAISGRTVETGGGAEQGLCQQSKGPGSRFGFLAALCVTEKSKYCLFALVARFDGQT